MKRLLAASTALAALAALAVTISVSSAEEAKQPAKKMHHDMPMKAATAAGDVMTPVKADNFRLTDQDGRARELYALKDAKAVVLVTQGVGCPIVRKMTPDLEAVRAAYAPKGVEFMMVNSNNQDTRETIAAEAKEFSIKMPIVKDDQQLVGEQLGAVRTAEVYVIEPKTWKIVYHGPLNDRLTYGKEKAKASKNYATDAIDAVIAGKQVAQKTMPTDGCLIDFPARTPAAKAGFKNISYAQSIAPIVEQKCVACHQQGGIGPFALDSYEKVKGFAPMIREVVRTRRMPPWDADPHVGKFADNKGLTDDQIKTLVHWIEAGAPRGEGTDPLTLVKHVAPEWPLGKPDLIVDIPSYTVPASGVVDYQYPTVPSPLSEGKWLKASTAKVMDRQVVHHILSGYVPPGVDPKNGGGMLNWGGAIGGYTVGMESVVQPNNIGTYIPPGGTYAFQMHYTPYGKESVSKQQIGLYFYKDNEKPELMMRESVIVNQFIDIPPNDGNHLETAYLDFPKDALLYSTVVHAHYRGNYSNLKIRYPDGAEKMLLNVPKYDFNWQRQYEFAEPIKIPAGSKLIATYIYDNSNRNPANPDPSKRVVWGEQSFEEMFYTQIRYRWVDETVAKQTNYDELMNKTRFIGMMDTNLDGKIQKSELRGQLGKMIADKFELADANHDGGIDAQEFEPIMKMMMSGRRPRAASAEQPAAAKPAAAGGGQK